MEFRESINGVVSVAKVVVDGPSIPPDDVALVKAELARHKHLWRGCRSNGGAAWVFFPSCSAARTCAPG